jgi:hypothetical protein
MEEVMNKRNISNTIDRDRKAVAGVQQHYASAPTIVLDGVPHTPSEVVKILQGQIDAFDATDAAKVVFHQTAAAQKAASATAHAVLSALKARVLSDFKNQPTIVADFGFAVPRRRAPKPKVLVEAAKKSAATREARHTMGPKAKLEITGTVPATPAATNGHS